MDHVSIRQAKVRLATTTCIWEEISVWFQRGKSSYCLRIYDGTSRQVGNLEDKADQNYIFAFLHGRSVHTYVLLDLAHVPRSILTASIAANEALLSLETYVNHMNTVQYYSSYLGEIAAAKSIGATYHMGETNTVACHGKDGLSNTMGALLWMIDYAFYMATLGADRLFFHNGKGDFFYSMWEPVALNESYAAHINPQ